MIAEAATCTLSGARFSWGFKESFRSYISGTIANGSWTTSGHASYKTPVFTFRAGKGSYSTSGGRGRVGFTGSIRFTGHEGALDTRIIDPRLVLTKRGTSYLVVDIASISRESAEAGNPKMERSKNVRFVRFSFAKATTQGDVVRVRKAATKLTKAGHRVFDSYPAGEPFDPLDIVLHLSPSC